jgi:glycosyltransferase involved in cell wall biosynthesis
MPWAPPRPIGAFEHLGFRELRRRSDWGKRGWRDAIHHIRAGIRLTWEARGASTLVVSHANIEVFVVALLGRLLLRRTAIVCFDFLIPRSTRGMALQRRLLRRVDRFLVIRRGDAGFLDRRYRIPATDVAFVRLAADPDLLGSAPSDTPGGGAPLVYSAGWAHRDWPTLLTALSELDCTAILSVPDEIRDTAVREGITLVPQVSPEHGRELMARAGVFALAGADTALPSGPLVLLDAMALGKAVVATDVNGTRDYLVDEHTGLLVAPGDVGAMTRALARLLTDVELRTTLGHNARVWASSYSVEDMTRTILEEVAVARSPALRP